MSRSEWRVRLREPACACQGGERVGGPTGRCEPGRCKLLCGQGIDNQVLVQYPVISRNRKES